MLKDGNASVKVANDQTQPVPVQLDRYGRSLSGNAVPVVLATDHDAVPVTSSSLPMVGGALGANGALFGPIPLVGPFTYFGVTNSISNRPAGPL